MNFNTILTLASAISSDELLYNEPSLGSTVRTSINYALSLAGFIGVLGVMIFPVGIILIILGTDKKKPETTRKKLKKWGLILAVGPFVLIITVMILFALTNLLVSAGSATSGLALFGLN